MKEPRYEFVGDDLENGVTVTKVNWGLIIPSIDLCVKYVQNPSHLSFRVSMAVYQVLLLGLSSM